MHAVQAASRRNNIHGQIPQGQFRSENLHNGL